MISISVNRKCANRGQIGERLPQSRTVHYTVPRRFQCSIRGPKSDSPRYKTHGLPELEPSDTARPTSRKRNFLPEEDIQQGECLYNNDGANLTPPQCSEYGPRIVTEVDDTDDAQLRAVSSRWILSPQAAFARKLGDASLKRCSPMIIESGDFVDVTATLDIVSIGRKPRDRRTDIHFAFTRIIRLMSRDNLVKVCDSSTAWIHTRNR